MNQMAAGDTRPKDYEIDFPRKLFSLERDAFLKSVSSVLGSGYTLSHDQNMVCEFVGGIFKQYREDRHNSRGLVLKIDDNERPSVLKESIGAVLLDGNLMAIYPLFGQDYRGVSISPSANKELYDKVSGAFEAAVRGYFRAVPKFNSPIKE